MAGVGNKPYSSFTVIRTRQLRQTSIDIVAFRGTHPCQTNKHKRLLLYRTTTEASNDTV
jgi:hypothetical protein